MGGSNTTKLFSRSIKVGHWPSWHWPPQLEALAFWAYFQPSLDLAGFLFFLHPQRSPLRASGQWNRMMWLDGTSLKWSNIDMYIDQFIMFSLYFGSSGFFADSWALGAGTARRKPLRPFGSPWWPLALCTRCLAGRAGGGELPRGFWETMRDWRPWNNLEMFPQELAKVSPAIDYDVSLALVILTVFASQTCQVQQLALYMVPSWSLAGLSYSVGTQAMLQLYTWLLLWLGTAYSHTSEIDSRTRQVRKSR